MARIDPIPMEQAQGKARELLDELVERGGEPGPMLRAMARAPALLRGYFDLSRAMKRSHLDRRTPSRCWPARRRSATPTDHGGGSPMDTRRGRDRTAARLGPVRAFAARNVIEPCSVSPHGVIGDGER